MSGLGEVRRFCRIVIANAGRALRGLPGRGLLQVCSLAPDGEKAPRPKRFEFDQSEDLIAHVLRRNEMGRNVYIEARTLRPDTVARGTLEETAWVFALVIDSDADKGRAWASTIAASMVVETSPGNSQHWFFYSRRSGPRRRARSAPPCGHARRPIPPPEWSRSLTELAARSTIPTRASERAGGRRRRPASSSRRRPASLPLGGDCGLRASCELRSLSPSLLLPSLLLPSRLWAFGPAATSTTITRSRTQCSACRMRRMG
jgi:hypothetical protein